MKNSSLWAFLGGVAVGAVVALLFAPDSGENTRKKIKASLSDLALPEEQEPAPVDATEKPAVAP